MPGPWHIAPRDLPRAFEHTSTPRSALASPEAANNLLATTLVLARATAASVALRAGNCHRLGEAPSCVTISAGKRGG
jgi:hypothetical protein